MQPGPERPKHRMESKSRGGGCRRWGRPLHEEAILRLEGQWPAGKRREGSALRKKWQVRRSSGGKQAAVPKTGRPRG